LSSITGVPGFSDYGMLGSLIAQSASVRQKLDQLTNQASSGLVGNSYAGLGAGAPVSLNLRPQIATLQAWQSNVDAATGRMSVAQSAMTQIQSIASNFYAQLNNVGGVNASAVDGIAASARDALSQVASLLDTQDGGVYVFAGQDTANPPVPDPANIANMAAYPTGYFAQINAAVSGLAPPGSAALSANATFAVAVSNTAGTSPFSTYLSQPGATLQLPTVQVGQNRSEQVGLLASANSLTPASVAPATLVGGPSATTGSYMRDVLRALATIGSLSSTQVNVNGFQDLVQDTRISLSGAITGMAQDAGVLGNVQSSLTATQSSLADTQTALTGQVSAVEDVDMASTLSQLSLVQTQMQASYQLISGMSGLSLVKFLPVA
jgi:flagellar hook-associated protein 3 FlgL